MININLHDLIREGFESYWYEELKTIIETMPYELKQLHEIANQKQEHDFCSDYEAFLTDKDISKFIKKLDEHGYCITKKQYISFFDGKEMTKLQLEIRINKVIAEVIK